MDGGIERKNSMKQSDSNREKILFFSEFRILFDTLPVKKKKRLTVAWAKKKDSQWLAASAKCA